MKRIGASVLIFALLAASPMRAKSAADSGISVDEAVARIQKFYSSSAAYRAGFVQTVAHKMMGGRLDRSYGTVMFKKGNLMRWEYDRPEKKLFIYDGRTLWVYEPEVPQVFKGTADAERLKRALAFLTGEGRILDEYKAQKKDASRYGFANGMVLKLTPKKSDAGFQYVELYVDTNDFHVARSVVVDLQGNRNRIDFSNPVLNDGLSADLFSFTPPSGVPVITPDVQGKQP